MSEIASGSKSLEILVDNGEKVEVIRKQEVEEEEEEEEEKITDGHNESDESTDEDEEDASVSTDPKAVTFDPTDNIDVTNDNNSIDVEKEKPLGKFQCILCLYNNSKKGLLVQHLRTHWNERPYKCNVCGKSYKSKASLRGHQEAHMNGKMYQCDECDKSYSKKLALRYHKSLKHTNMEPTKCSKCDYVGFGSSRLWQHMATHVTELAYKCTICSYSGATASYLKGHMMKVHTGEMKHECNTCGAKFRRLDMLKYHQERHLLNDTDMKPFQCTRCPSRFNSNRNMRNHMKFLHNIGNTVTKRPFKCQHCDRCFTVNGILMRHMETHHPNAERKKMKNIGKEENHSKAMEEKLQSENEDSVELKSEEEINKQ